MALTLSTANPIVSGYPDYIVFNGVKKPVDTHFRVWLQIARLFDDNTLTEVEKAVLAFNLAGIEHTDTVADLQGVNEFLAAGATPRHNTKPSVRVMDYDVDAWRIIASFQADYGIDITARSCALHWWHFNDLLRGLSNTTPIMQAVSIRTMALPEGNDKHTKERREQIIAAKRELALPARNIGEQAAKDKALWGD